MYPLYILCFLLNTFLYSDLARAIYTKLNGKPKVPVISLSRMIAYELHRVMMTLIYLAEVSVLFFIWEPLGLIMLTWLYSYYSFEYKWELEGSSLTTKKETLEINWAYFCGFGLPFTILTS